MARRVNLRFMTAMMMIVVVVAAVAPLSGEEAANPEEPIKNLQFQGAEIRSVLTFLADYGSVNVVIAPNVDGTVTIKLHNVGWREAMDIIGRTYDLAVIEDEANYIRIMRGADHRAEMTEKRKYEQENRSLVPLETRIIRIKNSSSTDIVDAVKSLLTGRGLATSDSRSNSIIIQDVPDNIEKVTGYVEELDRPSRQIKISAQLVDISSDAQQELGINWTAAGTWTSDDGARSITQEGSVTADDVSDPIGKYTIGAMQRGWSVEAFVEALVSDGKGKIVAHPEITTLENKEARIQMGQKVPIKQFDPSGNVVIQFEEVGTILRVTPHITAENQILMHLMPERSTFEFDAAGVVINTNNAETHVIVENGQTAVIGGLTTQDEIESESGVPILKDIPLLGYLFKYRQKRLENRDLVIFVTPTIVGDDLAMKN